MATPGIELKCRACSAQLSHTFVDLGAAPLCQRHVTPQRFSQAEAIYPQHVYVCTSCFLVQLTQDAVKKLGYADCKVHEFVSKMDYAYAIADLVVARAGAISVSELQLVQLPAILVPLPTAAEDHQTMNARALTDRGAAVLVKDDEAVQVRGSEIVRLISNEDELMKLRSTIAGLGQQNAAEAIAAEVIRLARS